MPTSRIDRTVIEAFFTWNSKGWELLILAGVFACILGLLAATHEFLSSGLSVTALGLGLVLFGLHRKTKLRKLYVAFKHAKNHDFIRVLLRSVAMTKMDPRNFAALPSGSQVQFDPTDISPDEQELFEALKSKALFLVGRHSDEGYSRFVGVAGQLVMEYSPIFVSIVYLTRSELIVYSANIDITKGDLLVEQVHRLFLRDVAEITTSSATERFARAANAAMFTKYEKAMKTTLETDMIRVRHTVQVVRRNGQVLPVLSSAPQYRAGEENVLDCDPREGTDPFGFLTQRISEAIQSTLS
jgi:hypothetical protein